MRMDRRALAAGAVLVTLAVAGSLLWWRSTADEALPINGASVGAVMILPKNQPDFTMGLFLIERPGAEVTVVEVKPYTSPNVEFLGAFTVWPRDEPDNKLQASRGFPPTPPRSHFDPAVRHPLGEVIPATETAHIPDDPDFTRPPPVRVMAGFRIRSGDVAAVKGVEIEYRVNGKRVRELFDHEIIACVDPSPCEPPAGMSESAWQDQILRQFGLLREES